LIIIKVFFSPTDAQLDSLKNNFKFALKLTLKSFSMSVLKLFLRLSNCASVCEKKNFDNYQDALSVRENL
jgi:hypothetical protein